MHLSNWWVEWARNGWVSVLEQRAGTERKDLGMEGWSDRSDLVCDGPSCNQGLGDAAVLAGHSVLSCTCCIAHAQGELEAYCM